MGSSEEIRKRISELGGKTLFRAEVATVKEVNEQTKTCTVQLLNSGLDLVNVRLSADIDEDDDNYCVQVPKAGSSILVARAIIGGFWFILLYGDLEKVIIKNVSTELVLEEGKITANTEELVVNGGNNGGLINAAELSKILNPLISALTSIKGVLNTPMITAGPGQPDVFHAALSSALSAVTPVQISAALIDEKVKH